jgi:predicted DNA-binding protein with PD1-like motif
MKVSQGSIGRIFCIRLEDGDAIPDCIEEFAKENSIDSGFCWLLGGIGGGKLIVGPEDGDERPVKPMARDFHSVHEALAFGTVFVDETGAHKLHMHASLGRDASSITGCAREGIHVWQLCEVLIIEGVGLDMIRKFDSETGFQTLFPK